MGYRRAVLIGAVIVCGAISVAFSQATPPAGNPAPDAKPLPGNWQRVDDRTVFLTVELSSVEESLKAIDKAIRVSGYNQAVKRHQAESYRKGNELMDRKGGGPAPWQKFYGTTAEKFFYHPIDRNTTYHTLTILRQKDPARDLAAGDGVASRQGLPVQQRPPQLDYIYRANTQGAARADREAAKFNGDATLLLQRKRQLESEQSALWCKIAFQALASQELSSKPLYRFAPKAGVGHPADASRLRVMDAVSKYLRTCDSLTAAAIDKVDQNQRSVLSALKSQTITARRELQDGLISQPQMAADTADRSSPLGRLSALARRSVELATNIDDAYRLALEGEQSGDVQRTTTFRGLLQRSLVDYAEAILATDECATALAGEWKLTPDYAHPLPSVKVALATPVEQPPVAPQPQQPIEADQQTGGPGDAQPKSSRTIHLLDGPLADQWYFYSPQADPNWSLDAGELVNERRGGNLVTRRKFRDFDLHAEFELPRGCVSGIFLRGRYQIQLRDEDIKGGGKQRGMGPTCECGGIPGIAAPSMDAYSGPYRWNSVDVHFVGQVVTVKINGHTVIDAERVELPNPNRRQCTGVEQSVWAEAIDHDEAAPGPIMLHCNNYFGPGSKWKNITITPLSSDDHPDDTQQRGSGANNSVRQPAANAAQRPAVVAVWRLYLPDHPNGIIMPFYGNGHLGTPDSKATWRS